MRRSPNARRPAKLRVAVVTGTRAEFGLLVPVMRAVEKHKRLTLQVVAAGAHFLSPARTIRDVEAEFKVAARVPMQQPGKTGRHADAAALGRGVTGFTRAFARLKPDWVVVLGDRIEAFAAASAASIAGIAVCHIHGGDRAEGIADEAMRHAITKLSHLHCAATKRSAERVVRLGENPKRVHLTGSPAIDGLRGIKPMSDREAAEFGDPQSVVLLHPSGLADSSEAFLADAILGELSWCGLETVVVLSPNADPGSAAIRTVFDRWRHNETGVIPANLSLSGRATPRFVFPDHLPRRTFVALLKRLALTRKVGTIETRGLLIGNSSAGLIEAAAIGLPVVNIGERQSGRERAANVIDVPFKRSRMWSVGTLEGAIGRATFDVKALGDHPYGDGRAGPRIANLLARTNPHDPSLLRKRNAY